MPNERSQEIPKLGWWKDKTVSEVRQRLAMLSGVSFDPDLVEFTHEIWLKSFRISSRAEELDVVTAATPMLYLPADYALTGQSITGPFLIGEAAQVEDYSPAFRFAFVRLANERPVYGPVPPGLELRPKS